MAYTTLKAAIIAAIKNNDNEEITGDILQGVLLSIVNSVGSGYNFAGVATPSTNPGTPDGAMFWIGGKGTYTNFGSTITVLAGFLGLFMWDGSSFSRQVVKLSGGDGIFDITDYTGNSYASLSAALAAVPQEAKAGGMSVKFVQSPDNKYVQYRLMATSFSSNEADWQGVDNEPTAGSDNLVKSGGVFVSIHGSPTFYPGYCIMSNYVKIANGDYNLSAKIDVAGMSYIYVKAESDLQVRLVAYAADDTPLDYWGMVNGERDVYPDSNVSYVILSYLAADDDVFITDGTNMLWKPAYLGGMDELKEQVESMADDMDEIADNVKGINAYTKGYFLTGNGVPAPDPDYCISDYIDVESFQKVKYHTASALQGSQVRLIEYNSSYQYVDNAGYNYNDVEFTRGASTKYVRLSFLATEENPLIYLDGAIGWNLRKYALQTELNGVRSGIVEIESNIENVKDSFGYIDNPPSYYFADSYLTNKEAVINSYYRECAADGVAFLFITDMHWWPNWNAQQSPKLINHIFANTKLNLILNGGDTVLNTFYNNEESVQRTDGCIKLLRDAVRGGKIYFAMGNHEWQDDTNTNLLSYLYDTYNDNQNGNAEMQYFFVDDERIKTRYIVLDIFGPEGFIGNNYANQLAWFTNTALNVSAGWHIIIVGHSFIYMDIDTDEVIIYPYQGIQAVISAVDNYSGDGEIVCLLQGEYHRDRIFYTNGGIPIIVTASDEGKAGDPQHPDINVDRTFGTIREQCFDVMIINYATKTIKAVRIGGKARNGIGSSAGDEVEERTITY